MTALVRSRFMALGFIGRSRRLVAVLALNNRGLGAQRDGEADTAAWVAGSTSTPPIGWMP